MRSGLVVRPIAGAIRSGFSPVAPAEASVIDMFRAFWPLDTFLRDLRSGEVSFAKGVAVMLDFDGSYGEVIPSLAGWCSTFERIGAGLGQAVDLGFMVRLARRVHAGMLIDTADIERFSALTDVCRRLFLACPTRLRHRCYLDECITMAVEDLGLREAA